MQLSGPEILRQMKLNNPHNPGKYGRPNIIIKPFDERCLGSNSYDLHLSPKFKVYKDTIPDGMKPYIIYNPGQKYSMRSWFHKSANDAYLNYLHRNPEYDFRNPKLLIDPTKEKETIEF